MMAVSLRPVRQVSPRTVLALLCPALLIVAACDGGDQRGGETDPPLFADRAAPARQGGRTTATAAPPLADAMGPGLARALIDCAARQYPFTAAERLDSARDLAEPQRRHPAFFGCGGPRAAVDAHRGLVRLLRLGRAGSFAEEAAAAVDSRLAAAPLASEARALARSDDPALAAALLSLDAELSAGEGEDFARWRAALDPLIGPAAALLDRALRRSPVPDRSAGRGNSADLLLRWHDQAEATGDVAALARIDAHAARLFGDARPCMPDADAAPGADLSPCLAEAALLARSLPGEQKRERLAALLADRQATADAEGAPPPLARPVTALARTEQLPDPVRFDVLNLARARMLSAIGGALPADDPLQRRLETAAAEHLRAGLAALRDGMPPDLASEAALALGAPRPTPRQPAPPNLSPIDRPTATGSNLSR